MQPLSPYFARQIVNKLDLSAGVQELASKLIDLLDGEHRANVAKIHETLFPLSQVNSANAQLSRLIGALEKQAEAKGSSLQVKITTNRKGGAKNRWVWFEGIIEAPALPYTSELEAIDPASLITDQRGLPTGENPAVILLTFNEHETAAVVAQFHPQGLPESRTIDGITYNLLGIHGGMQVIQRISRQGQSEAQNAAHDAISAWAPRAIIGVGIAFGVNSRKQCIGDVLVSDSIRDYELGRVEATIIPRGNKPPASDILLQRFNHLDQTLRADPKSAAFWPKLRFGTILSGNKLVDNLNYRDSLLKLETEAIGGEMEAVGILTAANRHKVDWIIVKAICDWGDGNKNNPNKETDQKTAAANAALVVKRALALGKLYDLASFPPGGKDLRSARAKIRPGAAPSVDCMNLRDHDNIPSDCLIADVKGCRASLKKIMALNEVPREKEGVEVMGYLLEWVADGAAPPLFCLLGEYGMGKSVTSQRLAKLLAEKRRQDGTTPMPLYFDLRHVTGLDRKVPTLKETLEECMERGWYKGVEHAMHTLGDVYRWMAQGAVVILDGLDEVLVKLKEGDGQVFTNSLLKLAADAKKQATREGGRNIPVKMLLSCRTQYFRTLRDEQNHFTGQERGELGAEAYKALVLLPLSENQIKTYLHNALPGSDPHRIFETLESVHNLKELAHRPYTLKLVAEFIPDIEQERMAGKTIYGVTLYRHMVRRWLERDSGKHHIRPDHKLRLSSHLAAYLWQTGSGQLPAAAIETWFHEWLETQPDLFRRYKNLHPDQLEEDLRTATFLTREDGADGSSFRFSHTSLMEYFLAEYLQAALRADSPEQWAIKLPSAETLDFLGQLLAEAAEPALLQVLHGWCLQYRRRASELLLAYALHARRQGWPQPPLHGIKLVGATLRDWRFDGRSRAAGVRVGMLDLSHADFSGADLRGSRFERVNLTGARFAGAKLCQANFLDCDATGSDWQQAECTATIYRATRLNETHWRNAQGYRPQFLLCEGSEDLSGLLVNSLMKSTLFAPSNTFVATVSDADNHLKLSRFYRHRFSWIESCGYSPDGQLLVSAGFDSTVRVWDAQSGELLLTLSGHEGWVSSCGYSPDGRRLVSAGEDSTVREWDAQSGELLLTLTGHKGWVSSCGYSPDGQLLVSAGEDSTVREWGAQSGELLLTLTGHEGRVSSCGYSPDGRRLVSVGEDSTVRVWDAQSGELLLALTGHEGWEVICCGYSPDGLRLVSAGEDSNVWDAQSGELLLTLSCHEDQGVNSCRYSPDGHRLVSAGSDRTVRVWDVQSGELLQTLTGHEGGVNSCGYSPDGRQLVSTGDDSTVLVWDAQSGELLQTLTDHRARVYSCRHSPDGRRLVTAGSDSTVRVWDVQSGELQLTLIGHEGGVVSCGYSPDGRRLVSAGVDSTVRVWDAQSGELQLILTGHEGEVDSCGYSPDGRRLVSAGEDSTVRVWDAQSGELQLTLTGHEGGVVSCGYSPDGRRLVSAGSDSTVRVWDAESGKMLRIHAMTGSDFKEDGHAVWTVEENKIIEACGDSWRTLAWVRPGPDGRPERLPVETFGPLPAPQRMVVVGKK